MQSFRGWTADERTASLKKTKQAIKDGIIPPATVCEKCGQDKGIVMYHNEDYSDPIKYLVSMCWVCHMMYHAHERAKEGTQTYDATSRYWARIEQGDRSVPVFDYGAWKVLKEEYGLFTPHRGVLTSKAIKHYR